MEARQRWKLHYVCPRCIVCGTGVVIPFTYYSGDQAAKIMFAAKAGWQYDGGLWRCKNHYKEEPDAIEG